MKVGIVGDIHPSGYEFFDKNNIEYFVTNNIEENNLSKELSDVDGIIIRTAELNKNILSKSQNLKIVARHGVGYDNVDTNYLKENNITLLVTHNSTSTSPAEHIMFMILNIYKGREMFDKMVRDGNFHKAIHLQIDDNFELFDKKILIVGFGRIGKKLIKNALVLI